MYDAAFNWSHALAEMLFTPVQSHSCLSMHLLNVFFLGLLCMLCVERHTNNVFEICTLKIHVHWNCGTDR